MYTKITAQDLIALHKNTKPPDKEYACYYCEKRSLTEEMYILYNLRADQGGWLFCDEKCSNLYLMIKNFKLD